MTLPVDKLHINARICENHFEDWCLTNSSTKNRLVWNAVPGKKKHEVRLIFESKQQATENNTVDTEENNSSVSFLDDESANNLTRDQCTQATPIGLTPKKKELKRKLRNKIKMMRRLRSKGKKLKEWSKKWKTKKYDALSHQLVDNGINLKSANFIARQVKLASARVDNRRYVEEDKLLAYNIMAKSKPAYRILQEVLVLPSESTLRSFIKSKCQKPGLNVAIISALGKIVKKKEEKYRKYVLTFDEMSINPYLCYDSKSDIIVGFEDSGGIMGRTQRVSNQLLVLMVRSLCGRKKMPIGFFFSRNAIKSSNLKDIIEDAIQELHASGIDICAIVCDQGPNNSSLFSKLCSSSVKPYFESNGKKIFTFFDPPHLLKSMRRNLMKYNLKTGSGTVSFKHIIDFYNYDKDKVRKLAPKLTDRHIFAEGLQSMKVSLASQVFSNTVAASMAICISAGKISPEAKETVELIGTLNDLFDSVNGSSPKPVRGKHFHCVVSKTSPHIKFWKNLINEMEKMKFLQESSSVQKQGSKTKKPSPKCINGWIRTLNAFILMFDELNKDMTFLIPKRFNQDCLENFFSRVRGSGGYRTNPTAYDVQSVFTLLCVNTWKQCSTSKNCEEDDDKFCIDLIKTPVEEEHGMKSTTEDENNEECIEDSLEENDTSFIENFGTDDIEINVNFYLAGYVAKKCLLHINCENCICLLSDKEKTLDSKALYTYFKSYNPNEKNIWLDLSIRQYVQSFLRFYIFK